MADEHNVQVASEILDELTTLLNAEIRANQGFDNNSVMALIKAWTKVGMLTHGVSYHRKSAGLYVMKRDPAPSPGKRSRTLLSALEAYESVLERSGTTDGDFFNRADQAMLDFVWEYRKHVTGRTDRGKSEADFVSQLMKWLSLSDDQAMQAEASNMDRSI
jgi:hypothetical protein